MQSRRREENIISLPSCHSNNRKERNAVPIYLLHHPNDKRREHESEKLFHRITTQNLQDWINKSCKGLSLSLSLLRWEEDSRSNDPSHAGGFFVGYERDLWRERNRMEWTLKTYGVSGGTRVPEHTSLSTSLRFPLSNPCVNSNFMPSFIIKTWVVKWMLTGCIACVWNVNREESIRAHVRGNTNTRRGANA